MNRNINMLREPGVFAKFCAKEDAAFGCRKAFGCYVACPLWRAREVEFLVNEKGMSIGEAHKASLRAYIEPKVGKEIVSDAMTCEKKEYPTLESVLDYIKKDT